MKRKVLFFLCLIVIILSSCEKANYCAQCVEINTGYNATDFCGESQEVDDYINDLTSQGADLDQEWSCSKIIE
tara:strand:- start:952 stop:1170 length:219 start_codon:yes stop_codon:yes gene_type:complete